MLTTHDLLRKRLYDRAGIVDHSPRHILPLDEVERQMKRRLEWIFEECRGRLLLAHFRYGDNDGKWVETFVDDIKRCVREYDATGNMDKLFDAINYCELEVNYAQRPDKHLSVIDDGTHSEVSLNAPYEEG